VSLLGENKIAAEGKTIAPEDFAFHRMAATALAVFMVVLWLFSRVVLSVPIQRTPWMSNRNEQRA
jgi:hypothetical protein